MGSYASLYVGGYPIASSKSFVDPTGMMLFTETDKRIRMPEPGEFDDEPLVSQEAYEIPQVEYIASLAVVRDRLEFMGYTLARVQEEFQQGVEECMDAAMSQLEYESQEAGSFREILVFKYKHEIELLKTITFDKWKDALGFIIRGKHHPSFHDAESDEARKATFSPLVHYLLSESPGEGVWTPFHDFRSSLRACVEVTGIKNEVLYDLTDIVANKYIEANDDLCAWARDQAAEEFVVNQRVIILTEGNTDRWCIEGALQILYPHLTEYCSFMDFEGARVEGGASALVSVIKAFIGAGIVNRIIGLFDNDTAARAALKRLRDIQLPATVRVLHLPDVDWAKRYPTLGPQGLVEMDVNGLAGSVELYLGLDVLRQDDGNLMPVQWRGYETGLGQYQGEVVNKARLQEGFSQKLAECRKNPDAIARFDWDGMRAIIDVIRTAFH